MEDLRPVAAPRGTEVLRHQIRKVELMPGWGRVTAIDSVEGSGRKVQE